MRARRINRLFHSVFTRLLITTLAAGVAITVTVITGFIIIHVSSQSAFERNLILYTGYLVDDLGNPPDEGRARDIAERSGMVIRFEHPDDSWQTGPLPRFLNFGRAWIRRHDSGVTLGRSKGHHFIRLVHAGGELTFVTPRDAQRGELAVWFLVAMGGAMSTILGLAYLYIRKTLNPLRSLKEGVYRFGAGRLDHRINETGASELRDLAQAFNAMATQLDRLLKSKEQLLLDVSHELRSPITRLNVQLEFIEDTEAKASLRADLAEMEAMVTALLESARLRHATRLNRETVDMAALIRSLIPDFQAIPPGINAGSLAKAHVPVDVQKIRILLRNLLENALKHTPDSGPPVSIALTISADMLAIVVEDSGEGIPAADLPHLFEPFYRPDTSRSRKTGGYGLGLSLCKAIVDAHGGNIEIASTVGAGTRVTVSLPRSADSQKS